MGFFQRITGRRPEPQGPTTRVTMRVSYGGELVAGESYDLPCEVSDAMILKGYADGTLSREYTSSEASLIVANSQTVVL